MTVNPTSSLKELRTAIESTTLETVHTQYDDTVLSGSSVDEIMLLIAEHHNRLLDEIKNELPKKYEAHQHMADWQITYNSMLKLVTDILESKRLP